MRNENGLSIIEMLFTILIISVIGIWSTSVFYNLQKSQHEKEELRIMQEKKNRIFRTLENNFKNSFESVIVQNNKLTVNSALNNGCLNNSNSASYEIAEEKLLCNGDVIYEGVKEFNFSLGYDDNGNGTIDTYLLNESKDSGELKSITFEIITQSDDEYFNNKEHSFLTLEGEKSLFSNYFLQIYRHTITERVY
jgi:type II secretory pathway pseudopilin PulG